MVPSLQIWQLMCHACYPSHPSGLLIVIAVTAFREFLQERRDFRLCAMVHCCSVDVAYNFLSYCSLSCLRLPLSVTEFTHRRSILYSGGQCSFSFRTYCTIQQTFTEGFVQYPQFSGESRVTAFSPPTYNESLFSCTSYQQTDSFCIAFCLLTVHDNARYR